MAVAGLCFSGRESPWCPCCVALNRLALVSLWMHLGKLSAAQLVAAQRAHQHGSRGILSRLVILWPIQASPRSKSPATRLYVSSPCLQSLWCAHTQLSPCKRRSQSTYKRADVGYDDPERPRKLEGSTKLEPRQRHGSSLSHLSFVPPNRHSARQVLRSPRPVPNLERRCNPPGSSVTITATPALTSRGRVVSWVQRPTEARCASRPRPSVMASVYSAIRDDGADAYWRSQLH